MCFHKTKKRKTAEREKGLLVPDDEFRIIKRDKRTYLDSKGKIKQDINYTLVPKEKKKTNWVKIVILTSILAVFFLVGFIIMCYAYDYSFLVAIFEFADNYLFLGAITLFIFLVFKSKK